MPKLLSLKLQEDVFQESDELIKTLHIPRNRYINQALVFYNMLNRRKMIKEQLLRESMHVRKNSLDYLKLLERLDDNLLE